MARRYLNELAENIDLTVTFSNHTLSKFEGTGAKPYCMSFARLMCYAYRPSVSGERAFNAALTNLPVFISADENLQFGWCTSHLMRNTDLHLYEYEHFILAAALGAIFSEDYCAAVLNQLGKRWEDGPRVNPSIADFKGFVQCVNGILSSTDFALIVDDRARLNPYRTISGHASTPTSWLVPPSDLANAIHLLGAAIGDGKKEVTIVGGDVLGMFAAAAEFLLSIPVHLKNAEHVEIYSTPGDAPVKLNLVFVPEHSENVQSFCATCSDVVFLMAPPSPSSGSAATVPIIPFTGSVVWDALLPKVFEHSFMLLAHQHSKLFGTTLGALIRLWETADSYGPSFIPASSRVSAAAVGAGLVQTIYNWFPEMRHLQGRMERAMKFSRDDAIKQCNDGAYQLRAACGCEICPVPYETLPRKTHGAKEFCLLGVMETIVEMALALSRVTVIPKLYPSRAGVLCIYQNHVEKMLAARDKVNEARHNLLFGNDWMAGESRRLQVAVTLFAGSWPDPSQQPDNLVALSHEGVCAYLRRFQEQEEVWEGFRDRDTIRVTSGRVSWKQKTFKQACYGNAGPVGGGGDVYGWEELKPSHLKEGLWCR